MERGRGWKWWMKVMKLQKGAEKIPENAENIPTGRVVRIDGTPKESWELMDRISRDQADEVEEDVDGGGWMNKPLE